MASRRKPPALNQSVRRYERNLNRHKAKVAKRSTKNAPAKKK